MSALATVERKSYNGKFAAKIDFPIGHFMLPLLMLTLEILSFSIHYLIKIWTTCWWNLNKIIWSEPYNFLFAICYFFFFIYSILFYFLFFIFYFFFAFCQQMVINFWQSVDAILEDVSATKTIVSCKKCYFKDYHLSVFKKITVLRHV